MRNWESGIGKNEFAKQHQQKMCCGYVDLKDEEIQR